MARQQDCIPNNQAAKIVTSLIINLLFAVFYLLMLQVPWEGTDKFEVTQFFQQQYQ